MNVKIFLATALILVMHAGISQPVTGVWRGKIGNGLHSTQIELKLVRQGDSLTGTSYYYSSPTQYARYRVKGYFDRDGDIIWQDAERIDSKGSLSRNPQPQTYLFHTSFNCPGENTMKLEGTASVPGAAGRGSIPVAFEKLNESRFPDEWDEVISDFPYYASSPGLIDSISELSRNTPAKESMAIQEIPVPAEPSQHKERKTVSPKVEEPEKTQVTIAGKTPIPVEEKFISRKKILTAEIPVSGDSITLNFYDHAEIDGDSIALFLNGKMLYQHILLKAEPFTIKIPVAELGNENELIMVAENLGSIPPNTSLMIAWCNNQRYEARLESTENSSAMIRFFKPPR